MFYFSCNEEVDFDFSQNEDDEDPSNNTDEKEIPAEEFKRPMRKISFLLNLKLEDIDDEDTNNKCAALIAFQKLWNLQLIF